MTPPTRPLQERASTSRIPRDLGVVAELVRLPAVLTVPGDTLLGAAAAGAPTSLAATVGRAAASSCLYLGGMALNDYADREVDAVERPHRPIPSGRIDPAFALRVGQALTAAGVAIAGLVGGRRALRVAVPLAASVWAYDLALKGTAAGPYAMAGCRALDVLLGATGGNLRRAVLPAAVVAGHTLTITQASQHEAQGGTPDVARRALWATAAVTGVASAYTARGRTGRPARRQGGPTQRRRIPALVASSTSAGLLAAYASTMGQAARRAVDDPSPARLQSFVGTGVLALMPLEGALLAGARLRRTATGVAVASMWPLARSLARRRAVT